MKRIKKLSILIIMWLFVISGQVLATSEIREPLELKTENTNKITKLIPLKEENIKDECIIQMQDSFVRMASVLIDDQDKVPQFPSSSIEKEELEKMDDTTWYPVTKTDINTISCYIDLKTTFKITHIAFKDVNGSPNIEFLQGTPFSWKTITRYHLENYLTWTCLQVENVDTRYLQIVVDSKNAGISEIALYGYQTGQDPQEPDTKPVQKPDFGITVDKAVGANRIY